MTPYLRIVLTAVVLMMLAACGDPGSTDAAEQTQPATPIVAGTGQCSASGLEVEVPEAPNLPSKVLSIRNEIIQNAVRCNYDALQELALRPAGSFQYSKIEESAGPEAAPAQFWRGQEEAGERVLASLVEILITDPEIQPVTEPEGPGTGSDDSYYNFPGTAVPEEEQQYQTSITSQGDWIFFLKTDEAAPTPSG